MLPGSLLAGDVAGRCIEMDSSLADSFVRRLCGFCYRFRIDSDPFVIELLYIGKHCSTCVYVCISNLSTKFKIS